MGGGGYGATYKGYVHHAPKRWHVVTGKGLCAVMWFWVLYRAKQDGPVVLGWRHPWEGHDDHSHGHGHGHENEALKISLKYVCLGRKFPVKTFNYRRLLTREFKG